MARRSVTFSVVNNPMLRFLLEDGTELVVQVVLTQVIRCDEKLPDGQPKYEFRLQHIVDQIAPEGEIDVKKLAAGGGT